MDCPASQASSMRARSSGVCLPPVIQAALEQTLTPFSSRVTSSSTLGPQRVVAAGVGLQGDERGDVVGRDARRSGSGLSAAQLGGVLADLVGAVGVDADQLQVGSRR